MTLAPDGFAPRPFVPRAFVVERIDLLLGSMRLVEPFQTSFGTELDRPLLIARVVCDGVIGYGESAAARAPLYSEETVDTNVLLITRHLGPLVLGRRFAHPRDLAAAWGHLKGNPMAKATLEQAVWDAVARREGVPLSRALGGTRTTIRAGVSIGIPPSESVADLLGSIERFAAQGYARMKVKIKPGWDVDVLRQVRREFPDTPLMADANAAYTVADAAHLAQLDDLDLTMIEQPLAHDDLVDHATLARQLATPICLDESVRNAEDVRRAAQLGAGRIINVKVGRVGGHAAACDVHDRAVERDMPLWCGGMLESGIGRLHNLAIASLPGFTLPGDTSASDRYWRQDLIDPPVRLRPDGTVEVPTGAGIGHTIDTDRLAAVTTERISVEKEPG